MDKECSPQKKTNTRSPSSLEVCTVWLYTIDWPTIQEKKKLYTTCTCLSVCKPHAEKSIWISQLSNTGDRIFKSPLCVCVCVCVEVYRTIGVWLCVVYVCVCVCVCEVLTKMLNGSLALEEFPGTRARQQVSVVSTEEWKPPKGWEAHTSSLYEEINRK